MVVERDSDKQGPILPSHSQQTGMSVSDRILYLLLKIKGVTEGRSIVASDS